jgi:adenylate cyclase, class 2
MARETEIKLRIADVEAFHRALRRIGACRVGAGNGRVHEENVIFDTPASQLANRGQLLRIRTETPDANAEQHTKTSKKRVLLTFKQPMPESMDTLTEFAFEGPYKIRDEIELEVADAANLTRIFEGLGMQGWFRYEKYRTTFQLPDSEAWAKGLLIELDETPIGTFVELEGPITAIDRAAEALGHSKRDYVQKNYLALYQEDCRRKGQKPTHMLFANRSNPSK